MRWRSPSVAMSDRGQGPSPGRKAEGGPGQAARQIPRLGMALALLTGLLLALAVPSRPAAASPCDVPADLLDTALPLPATERALASGTFRILVIGSASVFGPGSTTPAHAWPARLEAALREAQPNLQQPNPQQPNLQPAGLQLEVQVRGGRGMTAADMLSTIQAATNPSPHLVIWQVGTVEAARGMEPDWLAGRLATGLEGLKERGIDAVLMDQQFSRFLRANADIAPYQDTIRIAASAQGFAVFPRYELMRHWADTDRIDLERAPRSGRAAMVDLLGECLGQAMSAYVLRGAAAAGQHRN